MLDSMLYGELELGRVNKFVLSLNTGIVDNKHTKVHLQYFV